MKVGLRWLKDYITFPWDAEELADRLTAIGTAVDKIEPVFETFSGVIAARIAAVAPHPSRPDLRVLTMETGQETVTVVAAAPNCVVGLVVPLARPGAILPPRAGKPLTVRDFNGVASEGMCCSERDLGLTDDHLGLMELDAEGLALGVDIWQALELEESSLSFELTPNRADCLSVLGIAREIGTLVDSRPRRPEVKITESMDKAAEHLKVRIEDKAGCLRYAGRLIRGGRIGPSPFWLKRRLIGAGLRAINNGVDITNFVMMETGQPLHAFDRAALATGEIVVRGAKQGEEFTTLDGVLRLLPAHAVMITDGEKSVAIGGVMGGEGSEVSPSSTDFLIEGANFATMSIRRTRTKLGLATDAALRFEKGVDPNIVPYALDRAAQLYAQLTGGEILAGIVDCYPSPIESLKLELEAERVNRLLGTELSTPTVIDLLSRLEFGITTGKTITVTVPTFRPDITRQVDLIEEVARLYGYERIPIARHAAGRLPVHRAPEKESRRRLRELVEGLGFTEIICNSITDPSLTLSGNVEPVALRNPLSADLSVMRADLYGSLLQVVAHNRNRRVDAIAVYEIGKSFARGGTEEPFTEKQELLLALCGQAPVTGWDAVAREYDFFDLKGALSDLFGSLDLLLALEPVAEAPFQAGEAFAVIHDGARIGIAGLIAPEAARRCGVKDRVWAATIAVDAMATGSAARRYRHLPRFPAVYRDLAVVIGADVSAGDLTGAITAAGGELLEAVRLFDRYTGKPIPKGKLSLAFAITYRHADRTLTDTEVDTAHAAVVAKLAEEFGAELRL